MTKMPGSNGKQGKPRPQLGETRFQLRLKPAVRTEFEAAAKAEGRTLAAWLRAAGLDRLAATEGKPRLSAAELAELKRLRFEVTAAGNLLNRFVYQLQLAREDGRAPALDASALVEVARDLAALEAEIRTHIAGVGALRPLQPRHKGAG